MQPLNQVVSLQDEGEVQFVCSATGYPSPTIKWYHNDNDVSLMLNKYRVDQDQSSSVSSLTILNLYMRDSGNVRCVAMVELGGEISSLSTSETAQLSVLGMR